MSSYRFCAESAGRLRRFLAAASAACDAGPGDRANKWCAYFARPHSPPPHSRDACTPELSSDETPSEHTPHENIAEAEEGQCLCELVESECREEGRSLYDEVVLKCAKNTKLLEYLGRNLTENAAIKLSQSVCESNPTDIFLNLYFSHFLPTFIKKEHSRSIDNLLLQNYKAFPANFKTIFFPIFLNDSEISRNIFSNFVKALNTEDRNIILNEIANVNISSNQFIAHASSILFLYKGLSEYDAYIQGSVVKMLCTHSEIGSKDSNYGKLLLALIQKMDGSGNMGLVENLCLVNESTFKKPCMNALNKLKNA